MTIPTDEQLAEWQRLADAAHTGPWEWAQVYEMDLDEVHWAIQSPDSVANGKVINCLTVLMHDSPEFLGEPVNEDPDLAFIAAARQAVPALLEAVRESRSDRESLRSVLRDMVRMFDRDLGTGTVGRELCDRAREALGGAWVKVNHETRREG